MLQTVEKDIWNLIEPGVDELGLRVVRVRFVGGERNGTLQVMIEPKETTKENPISATVDQCTKVSRMASALLDVEDVITNRYNLEISSTGMERPLVTEEDFGTYKGERVKIQMAVPFEKKRKFIGILEDCADGQVQILQDEGGEMVQLPYEQIKYAHLYFTDEDMKKMMNGIEG